MVSNQRSPTLAQAFADIIAFSRADIRTSIPAQVINVASNRQSCDVQIVMNDKQPAANGVDSVPFPTIAGVRVGIMNGGGFFCSFPLAVGDFVWLSFAGQSIDRWITQGGVGVDDPVVRFHDLADALAVPMIRPATMPIGDVSATAMVLGKDGGPTITIEESDILLGNATNFVALANLVNTGFAAITSVLSGGITTASGGAGTFTAAGDIANIPTDVSASKVKAE
jgi:protein gp138